MIRQANKSESLYCTKLLMGAMENIGNILTGFDEEDKIIEVLNQFVQNTDNKLSYEHILIKEIDSKVVGAICAYDGGKEDELNRAFIDHLNKLGKIYSIDKECFAGEFYIDSISVDSNFRKKGYAKELIDEICKKAAKLGFSKVSLIADKPKNIAYYEKLGFKIDCKLKIHSSLYFHMIKEI